MQGFNIKLDETEKMPGDNTETRNFQDSFFKMLLRQPRGSENNPLKKNYKHICMLI
jgi:hypothetical protein